MLDPSNPTTRRVPMLVLLACAGALLFAMMLAVYGGLPGDGWLVGLPLNLVPAIGVTALLWAAAFGLGDPLVRWLFPTTATDMQTKAWPASTRVLAQAALGMAALLLLWFVLFSAAAVHLATAALPVVAGLGLLALRVVQQKEQLNQIELGKTPWPWTLVALMPGVALLLAASACPPGTLWRVEAMGYDVTSYHLQVPKEWIALGKATPLDHNVYSFFPGLMEHGYTALGLFFGGGSGGVHNAVYACSVFHASFALLVVWGVVETAKAIKPDAATAALVAGGALLLVPWVVVTGSLAYNDVAVLGFGAAALCIALLPGTMGWRRGAALGLLLGVATLCKLTAGPMLVVPIVLLALMPDVLIRDPETTDEVARPRPTAKHRLTLLAAIAAAGLLTLAPYLARNAIATGNPVFPFATSVLGSGHWDDTLADRWHDAHTRSADQHVDTIRTLKRQWLGNTGYGALGGRPVPAEPRNIARFPKEHGLPILWLAALTGFALMLGHPRTWRPALAMLGFTLWQLVFWRLGTHLQSRFLLFTLLPAGVVLGVGAGRVREVARTFAGILQPVAAALLLLSLLTVALTTLWGQTSRMRDGQGNIVSQPVWMGIDALGEPGNPEHLGRPGTHPINLLPPDSRTLIIADNSTLLYIDRPIVYSSAFDANPLGAIVRSTDGSVAAINAALRDRGITHVWLSWGEAARLSATYGFDESLTFELLQELEASWLPAMDPRLGLPLYAVPPAVREQGNARSGGAGILPAIAAQP